MLFIVVTTVVLVIVGGVYVSSLTNQPFQPFSINSKPTVAASSASSSVDDVTHGLQLILRISINSTGGLSAYLNESNTQSTINNITASSQWQYADNRLNYPCGNFGDYPLGVAVFQGYYGLNNFTSASALALYNTRETFSCPTTIVPPISYRFSPLSGNASVSHANGYTDYFGIVSIEDFEAGYWTGSGTSAAFHPFSGTYTVLGEDEWGGIILLHFSVILPPLV